LSFLFTNPFTPRTSPLSLHAALPIYELTKMISDELGTTSLQPVILVGVGNLGLALLSYRGFEKEGFEIAAAFDAEPRRRRDKKIDRKSTRLNSSHVKNSYAVFCLKKK